MFKHRAVLLGQRGKAPFAGLYSLPGGAIKPGERPEETALRELLEETGIEADIAGALGEVEIEADGVYRIAVFYGLWRLGEPQPGDDCVAVDFVPLERLENYRLTEGTAGLIRRAAALLGIENG